MKNWNPAVHFDKEGDNMRRNKIEITMVARKTIAIRRQSKK